MATTEQGNGFHLGGSGEKLTDTGKSYGSDTDANGDATPVKQVDKYGFTGGAQQYPTDS